MWVSQGLGSSSSSLTAATQPKVQKQKWEDTYTLGIKGLLASLRLAFHFPVSSSDSDMWGSQIIILGAQLTESSEGLRGSEQLRLVLEARRKALVINGYLSQNLQSLPMPHPYPGASSWILPLFSAFPQPFLVSILASWPPHPLGFWEEQNGMEQWPKIRTHNRSMEG